MKYAVVKLLGTGYDTQDFKWMALLCTRSITPVSDSDGPPNPIVHAQTEYMHTEHMHAKDIITFYIPV